MGNLHFAEGWDYGSATEYTDYLERWGGAMGTGVYIDTTGGYLTNEGLLRMSASYRSHDWKPGTIPEIGPTFIFGFCVNAPYSGVTDDFLELRYSGSEEITIAITNGVLSVKNGGTTLCTGTTTILNDGWHYITLQVTLNNTTGSVYLYLDHALECSATSVDTSAGGNLKIDGMYLRGAFMYYDHLLILDSSGSVPTEDWVVQRLDVDGAGNYSQFTPSAGSNYQNVDEADADYDTTYNETATVNNRDSFSHEAPGMSITGSIEGIVIQQWIKNIGPGTRTVKPFVRISSTDYDQTEYTPGSDYRMYKEALPNNPNTAASWTSGEIGSLETGVKVQS